MAGDFFHSADKLKSKGEVFMTNQDTAQNVTDNRQPASEPAQAMAPTKFCKFCGAKIPMDAVICTACGRQVEELRQAAPSPSNIVINNNNANTNTNVNNQVAAGPMVPARAKNKYIALLLCIFLGFVGGHKFYEGKIGMGILYIFTGGLFMIGVIVDFLTLLFKPATYYVV